MFKDEGDIIGPIIEHMVRQVDHVVCVDNASTDGSGRLAVEAGAEVLVDPDPAYYQSAKMTNLMHYARSLGADWVIPFDADELWVPTCASTLAGALAGVAEDVEAVACHLTDRVPTGDDDPNEPNPIRRMTYVRPNKLPLFKVALRPRPTFSIDMGNHGASNTATGTAVPAADLGIIGVHHYPYRSEAQFVRKVRNGAAAYAATDLPEHFGAHWRQWGAILDAHGEAAVIEIFQSWYYYPNPSTDPSVIRVTT